MSESLLDYYSLDRSAIRIAKLKDQGSDMAYWQSQSPLERLRAGEYLRQLNYGYDPDTTRLSRTHRPTKRKIR